MKRAKLIAAALLLILSACGSERDELLHGYAEADYLYLAPRAAGYVDALNVKEGDQIAAGAPVFVMDSERARAALNRARASEAAAGGQTGANAQALAAAVSNATLTRTALARTRDLFRIGTASKAQVDEAQNAYESALAAVKQARAQTGAAGQTASAAKQDVLVARADMEDRTVRAPEAGRIELVFRRPGEFAPAGQPVVALLPPANIKLRFFAPEQMLAKLRLGQSVRVSCDGCAGPIEARITFIASDPQFTPPVIYSLEERDKLVFLVEARPVKAPEGKPLRPGQPVDIGLVS